MISRGKYTVLPRDILLFVFPISATKNTNSNICYFRDGLNFANLASDEGCGKLIIPM